MSQKQQRLPDLLRERRLELGRPQDSPPLMPKGPLLLRGALLGGAAVGVALASVVGLGWIEAAQQRELETLLPFERQVRSLEGQIKTNKGKMSSLKRDTLQIAEQLVAVPAGSPLLEQLRRVTPVGIQLEDVSVQSDRIKVSGKAAVGTTPGPLERINALAITLARLPISKADGVKVLKLTREDGDTPVVNFSLDWVLDPKAGPSIQQLEALGAEGLAERYRLLEQQGVPL
ncbi:fimbrial assembly family protein [Synechococcus sp. PROS-7-1]|uniref:PilN domain-containing protein n=1 Tax=Synechococcus sp. PROS-7-1 TaxID=1442556 RepID=UPI001646E9E8|nr:PilN domain-containing protein [Synechococcus sp. PROS-7-1]QNI86442.1 fimbrial assembly family protein [Synechococcus sp. PROS-7-1]